MSKKIIAMLLLLSLLITSTISTFASDDETSVKDIASTVQKEVVNEIVKVNNLSLEVKSVVEKSISEKISKMNKEELKNLQISIKTLASEKKNIDKMNNTRSGSADDRNLITNSLKSAKAAEGFVALIYVGTTLAKLTGYMLMCDEAGSELIDAIILAGGGAATIGLGIATVASCTIGIGIATAIGGYLALQWGMIKIQLYFSDYATAYI
ncbi:hypothetical protein LY28_03644 [Ruminiclostridium sufflavum DSM 19573]|uniref:Colicin import membrane protein n=1 Tax=Ruminiclostridium sufflavum DSM 19573 TaxID=1121337 RepID=A0A318XRZ4_9FIRM|nr:hypothetical protein [Ruminiclostridium sufflavum]PYG84330.1 hypothetical protein LY28_03644 [Ruminiclostridium sufflavum DSM 19573]